MKISTKGRYGARALLDLADHYGKGQVLLKDIAKREDIPIRYLEQLIAPLRSAGLVKGIRGARGGYILTKPPSQIRLSEILEILEGSLEMVDCIRGGKACNRIDICITRDIWDELNQAMRNLLESITLDDMVRRKREKQGFTLPGVSDIVRLRN